MTWGATEAECCARTLEESFALANLVWTQHEDRTDLLLRVRHGDGMSLDAITAALYKKVVSKGFQKTDFALALLNHDEEWAVPPYIHHGLTWLTGIVVPTPPVAELVPNGETVNGQQA